MHTIFRWTTALILALGMAVTAHADDTAAQIRQHAGDHRLLVLGEFHGTRETPLLVRQLVDGYSRTGPVLLALELPRGGNPHAARLPGFRWRGEGTPPSARACVLDRAR